LAAAVVIENLVKLYAGTPAVDGVGLEIKEGEVFALLGPNGAGKTTLIEILEGHRRPTSGTVKVLGFDPQTGGREFRERIGIMLQEGSVEAELTVREAVEITGRCTPIDVRPPTLSKLWAWRKRQTPGSRPCPGAKNAGWSWPWQLSANPI
jgi:ABC-type multidrug transport system ATPase subunit